MSGGGKAGVVKLFDAHCHLQDPRISAVAPQIIRAARDSGVLRLTVNGTHEKDWHLVKQMAEHHPSVIPCFGLHPWWVAERSPNWMASLRELFAETPSAAVGEIGLDKGSHGKNIEFMEQVEVFRQQLELAKDLERPASIHCVRAFGDLLEIMQHVGPFPAGVILHSYLGSAEMVSEFAKLGSYFSFSGFIMSMKLEKAKKMLKAVPSDRILLESDAPDALPTIKTNSSSLVRGNCSTVQELLKQHGDSASDESTLPAQSLNHPANIHVACYVYMALAETLLNSFENILVDKLHTCIEIGDKVLEYVATLCEMAEEDLAEASYQNAMRLFHYAGSVIGEESLED